DARSRCGANSSPVILVRGVGPSRNDSPARRLPTGRAPARSDCGGPITRKRRWAVMRKLFAAGAVARVAGPLLAQTAPKPDDKTLYTRTYNLKAILGDRGKASGIADTDAVIKLILETIPMGELKPGTDGLQIIERDGGKLEVRATAKIHGEIKDL